MGNTRGNNNRQQNENACRELNFDANWITRGPDENMIKYAERMAECMKSVSSSRLRNIYGEVMRIKLKGYDNERNSFFLLKPKVTYNYARIKSSKEKSAFENFKRFFDTSYDLVLQNGESAFKNFVNLFEAILAYHKQHRKD